MKSEEKAFLERWAQATDESGKGWRESFQEGNRRVGFGLEETSGHVIRRVFHEEQQGPVCTMNLLEWKKNKEYGAIHLSKSVCQSSPSKVRCVEGKALEMAQGATSFYELQTMDDGYLYCNAGGRGSWESQVYSQFKEDFETRWQSVMSRTHKR